MVRTLVRILFWSSVRPIVVFSRREVRLPGPPRRKELCRLNDEGKIKKEDKTVQAGWFAGL
jgi:hypothetical protein